MQSPDRDPGNRSIDWQGILRTLIVQVLVLLALSYAFVRYVDWSSDRAMAEFSAASLSAAPGAKPHPRSAAPVQVVKAKTPCFRSA